MAEREGRALAALPDHARIAYQQVKVKGLTARSRQGKSLLFPPSGPGAPFFEKGVANRGGGVYTNR